MRLACWIAVSLALGTSEIAAIKERFFAISAERRIQNPAVAAITDGARAALFD